VAEGRGTTIPFQIFGAPFLNSQVMAKELNDAFNASIEGQVLPIFRGAYFEPTFSKYNNTVVPSVQWIEGRGSNSDFMTALQLLITVKGMCPPDTFQWDGKQDLDNHMKLVLPEKSLTYHLCIIVIFLLMTH
jgi:uncharacterized protein YbbC (DUF1343 family)